MRNLLKLAKMYLKYTKTSSKSHRSTVSCCFPGFPGALPGFPGPLGSVPRRFRESEGSRKFEKVGLRKHGKKLGEVRESVNMCEKV